MAAGHNVHWHDSLDLINEEYIAGGEQKWDFPNSNIVQSNLRMKKFNHSELHAMREIFDEKALIFVLLGIPFCIEKQIR